MIALRKANPAFGPGATTFFDTGSPHVLGFVRSEMIVVLANFSDYPQIVTWEALSRVWQIPPQVVDLITDEPALTHLSLVMPGHGIVWLAHA